ncbi:MAG: hypothetical protein QM783_10545 [Phycisphaerales bacterium]
MPPSAGNTGSDAGDPASGTPTPAPSPLPLPGIAVSLEGKLPCVVCRYDLRGVSILGVCPECGTAVRATLLAVVDPLADELRPIDRPRTVAIGLLVWIGALSLAGLLTAWSAIHQIVTQWQSGQTAPAPQWLAWVVCVLVLVAGVGATFLTRPHARVPQSYVLAAWAGVAAHLPLAGVALMLGGLQPLTTGIVRPGSDVLGPFAVAWDPAPDRSILRSTAGVLGLFIIVAMRPVARVLVARSLAIRTGRVDRQTMLATAAAIAVFVTGDLIGLLTRNSRGVTGEWGMLAAGTLVAFGGVLLGLGLLGSLVDAVRIARAVVRPGPSLRQVVGKPVGPGGSVRGGGRP